MAQKPLKTSRSRPYESRMPRETQTQQAAQMGSPLQWRSSGCGSSRIDTGTMWNVPVRTARRPAPEVGT